MQRPWRHRAAGLLTSSAVAVAGAACGGSSVHSPPRAITATTAATAAPGITRPPSAGAPPAPEAPPSPGTSAAAGAWLAYGNDATHRGVDPSSPAAGPLARAWTATVDGDVLAEPLVVDGQVIVATEADTVYALDAATGRVRWTTHLGTPVPGSRLPCGDIDPSGITGTPVVDAASTTVWAVAFIDDHGLLTHQLVGLDVASGSVRSTRPADPAGADPTVEQQRAALALDAGRVIVAYGGLFGDCGPYHGAVVSMAETGGGPAITWTVPTAREGGIWAPGGPDVEPDGTLLVSTGNAASTSAYDDANAVVKLSGALAPVDLWAPANWASLSADDLDESSTAPAVLASGQVVTVGKEGTGYLLDGTHLGGVGGELASVAVCRGSGAYGGTAVQGSTVYEPCRDGLRALQVGPGAQLSVKWKAPGTFPGAPVIAGGLVWVVDHSGSVRGLDPGTGALVQHAEAGKGASPFASAAAAGGSLYVPAGNQLVAFTGI